MIRAREAGYTIIELLVSLFILSLMTGLLFSSVGVGQRAWDRAAQREAGADGVAAAERTIRERLEGLVPVTEYASRPYADMEGQADKLFFFGPAASAERPNAITVYRLSLSTGSELVLSSVSDLSPTPERARRDEILLRNVAGLELAYFGAAPPDNIRRWRDRWVQQPAPPELIRLRIRLADGDRWTVPEMLVRPAATVDLNCVLNPQTGRCRGR